MGGVGGHRDAHGLHVARTEKVSPSMEPTIEFCPSGRALTGELIHFRPDAVAQLNQSSRQSVELILKPGTASRAGSHTAMEAVEKGTDPAAFRMQAFVPVRCWGARRNLIELLPLGGGDGVSNVLHKASLEEQGQGFRSRGSLEFQGILLPIIKDQERILRYQVPPLPRHIECRSARD